MARNEPAYDVVVVGAGNAALCAALSAREHGASVVVLEKAPPSDQGGNCPYTGGGFRFVHEGIEDLRSLVPELTDGQVANISMGPYTAQDFSDHLMAVTHGETDPELMEVIISQSRPTVEWMHSKGVTWELPDRAGQIAAAPSTIPSSVGLTAWRSGVGLVQMLTTACRRAGIDVVYETKMLKLLQDSLGGVCGVSVKDADGVYDIRSRGVVLACGGFEANQEMRLKYLGGGWERAKVRGAKYNTGDGHRAAMEVGAKPIGQWTGCHATPIDYDAPPTGVLEATDKMPRRSYPLGITVNIAGRRFFDEGAGFAEQTFVNAARHILDQPRGLAFQVFDSKAAPLLEARYGVAKAIEGNTILELAEHLEIRPEALTATTEAFNAQAHHGEYVPRQLDGRSTQSIDPPKTNWALKIDSPPFVAYKVTGGITYTYGGPKINGRAQVVDMEGRPIPGLFAAGEMVGGILFHNSLRAAGLMHGAVFGKLAGANAAEG